MVLLKETKRLQLIGNHLGEPQHFHADPDAMSIESDLDVVTNVLKTWASYSVEGDPDNEKMDVAAFNRRMLDTLRAASLDEWAAAVTEARRRGSVSTFFPYHWSYKATDFGRTPIP
jgi:hypothetical protein